MTHPRTYGAFPKKMRMFVFDEPAVGTPEFVIRRFSGLAADFLHGSPIAVIFAMDRWRTLLYWIRTRYQRQGPRSTRRKRFTEGVEHVLVNGVLAIRDGQATGALAGKALKRPN